MTHISRRKLPTKTLKQILNSLVYVLTETKNKEEMTTFLNAFLSETEKIMLAKRIVIAYLLNEKVEGDKIAAILHVTPFTVSRIKLWYETKGEGYKVAIGKLKKQKYLETIKLLGLKTADRIIRAAIGHTP